MYINNKSMFNLLTSTTKPYELIKFAKSNDLPAIGICDVDTAQGFHSLLALAKKEGVTAILAVDTFVIHNQISEKVLLICKNHKSLFEINKALSSKDTIARYEQFENTIVVFQNPHIKNIKNKDYRGITRTFLASYEGDISSDMLLIDETHFANKQDFEYFKIVNCIRNGELLNQIKVDNYAHSYLRLEDEQMWYYPDLYQNYQQLVAKLESIQFTSDFKLPHFPSEHNNREYLYKLMYAGLNRRLNMQITDAYRQRLEYEFKVISDLDFVDYFLIVWDIIKFCRKNDIYVGPGRGSAAGSLLAYCLGITSVDPIAHDLLFERFLNPMRKTMPDIDLDFEDTRRDEIINYIFERYGEDYVCQIGTLSTFQAKSSFREIAKVYGVSQNQIKEIAKQIDGNISFKQNIAENSKLRKLIDNNSTFKYILDYIYKIEATPKNKSIHAAGIIISDEPIYAYTSVSNHVSDVDSKVLEKQGLVKFDILAISNLRHLHNIEMEIASKYNRKYDFNNLNMEDSDVYYAIGDGLTNFVFQLESKGMIATLRKFRPKSFSELAVILALYRPGPMEYIDEYIERKNGKVKVHYIDDSLEYVLKPTFGIIVYQEQIMEIVKILANYDYGQADMFRRAISKKDKILLSEQLNQFVKASVNNGYSQSVAIEAGKRILAFANYGFNKAHAVSYAKISYALMYYKINYPDVYYSYYLQYLKASSDMAKFELEIGKLNLKLLPPSLQMPSVQAISANGKLQLGFSNISKLDRQFVTQLVEYLQTSESDIISLIDRVIVPAKLATNEIESLVASGVFANSEYNERTLIDYICSKDDIQDQFALNFFSSNAQITKLENYDILKLEQMERDSLHINIRYNSYETYFKKLKALYPFIKRIDELDLNNVNQTCDILVNITNVKEIKTKTNKLMAFIDVKVETQETSLTVFPQEYEANYTQINGLSGYALVQVKIISNGLSLLKIKKI